MLDILQGTPLWVYAIYLWICYYGIKACLGGCENRRSLMILPVVLVVGGVSGFTVGLFCGRADRLQRALSALRRDKASVLP